MKRKNLKTCALRVLTIALAVVVAVTVLPITGGNAYGAAKPKIVEKKNWATPYNWPSMYDVYIHEVRFNTKGNYAGVNPETGKLETRLYMDYRVKIKGNKYGPWITKRAFEQYWEEYRLSGFKSNAVYQTRLYYAKYDRKRNIRTRGPYSKVVEFRTGSPIQIKSIKVTPVNMRKMKQHVFGYVIYWGSLDFYRYRYKITVELKKKPSNAMGMMINGKRATGCKKVYTVYSPYTDSYKKPYGKSYTVVANTYTHWRYGGWSQPFKKTVKIR